MAVASLWKRERLQAVLTEPAVCNAVAADRLEDQRHSMARIRIWT